MTDDELQTLEQVVGILRDAVRQSPRARLDNLTSEADRAAAIIRALVARAQAHREIGRGHD